MTPDLLNVPSVALHRLCPISALAFPALPCLCVLSVLSASLATGNALTPLFCLLVLPGLGQTPLSSLFNISASSRHLPCN